MNIQVSESRPYSGTGNISYEFMSRGSLNITSVDHNRLCVNFIKKTSRLLNMEINAIQSDSINFLKNKKPIHLIFADPPYKIHSMTYKYITDFILIIYLLMAC